MKKNLNEEITQKIIAAIESGDFEKKWVKPWIGGGLPANLTSGKKYRGTNILSLWLSQDVSSDYDYGLWVTFLQTKDLRLYTVKRGEKASYVSFFSKIEKEENKADIYGQETQETEKKTKGFCKNYAVFNVDQTDIDREKIKDLLFDESQKEINKIENVEKFISSIPHKVKFMGHRACYMPDKDMVILPERNYFKSEEDFYATYLHELAHWTGHTERLNRKGGSEKSSPEYAFEELVAELSSAFLCASLGIKGKLQHTQYLASWVKILQNSSKAIVEASYKAQAAFDLLNSFQDTEEKKDKAA